jgi:hypothetical protein
LYRWLYTGLLGIALANEEYADEAVQTQLIPTACKYFQKAVMTPHQLSTAQHAALVQQQQQHASSWDRHKTPAKSALKAAAAAAGAALTAATAAAAAAGRPADGSLGSQDQVMLDQQQQQASGALSADQQQQQQQVLDSPGNALLSLVAASPDGVVSGVVPSHEVVQLRLRKLLGVMRVLTCTGGWLKGLEVA